MVFDKMVAICPYFKWLGFRISDHVRNPRTSFGPFKIQTVPKPDKMASNNFLECNDEQIGCINCIYCESVNVIVIYRCKLSLNAFMLAHALNEIRPRLLRTTQALYIESVWRSRLSGNKMPEFFPDLLLKLNQWWNQKFQAKENSHCKHFDLLPLTAR